MVKRKYRKKGGRKKQRGGNTEMTQTSDPIANRSSEMKKNFMSLFAHCSYDMKMKFIGSSLLVSILFLLSSFFQTSKSSFNSGIIGVSSLLAAAIFSWGLYSKTFIINGENQVNVQNVIKMMIPLIMIIPVLGIQIYLNSGKEKVMKQIANNMPQIYVMNFVTYVLVFIHVVYMIAFLCKCSKIGNVIIGTYNTILFFCLSLFSTILSVTVLHYVNSFGTDG